MHGIPTLPAAAGTLTITEAYMNRSENKEFYFRGIKNGIPICLGYLAVSFTLGIIARDAGMTPFQAMLTSITVNASAGQYAGFTLVAANAGYLELAVMIFVANARYLLMSCSMSQKFAPGTKLIHRLLVGFDLTDEIFGVAVTVPGKLNPFYNYGMMTVAIPGWAIGTFLGVIMGNILPSNIVSALSVGLYGMFLAIIIPPARKSKVIAGLIAISMTASFVFSKLPYFSEISAGVRIIILTIAISAAAAILFPIQEDKAHEP